MRAHASPAGPNHDKYQENGLFVPKLFVPLGFIQVHNAEIEDRACSLYPPRHTESTWSPLDVPVGVIAHLEEASNPIKKRYRGRGSAIGRYY